MHLLRGYKSTIKGHSSVVTSQLVKVSDEAFAVSGDLMMHTVMPLLNELNACLKSQSKISIDFSKVGNSDSAALALIVAWLAKAKQLNIKVQLKQLPKQILDIAKASDLLEILPID